MSLIDKQEAMEDARAQRQFDVDVQEARERLSELRTNIREVEGQALALQAAPIDGLGVFATELEILECKKDQLRTDTYALVACALGGRYTTGEVARWCLDVEERGAQHPEIDPYLIEKLMYVEKVPNAPLRQCIEDLAAEIDHETGEPKTTKEAIFARLSSSLKKKNGKDMDRRDVPRLLGFSPYARRGKHYMYVFIDYNKAVTIARTLGISPHEVGL